MLAVVLAAAPGLAASRARKPAVRSNLCTLKIAKQVHALGMYGKCTPHRAAKVGSMIIASADWGTGPHGVGITVYGDMPKATFRAEFVDRFRTVVRIGSFARYVTAPAGVALTAWVRGLGLFVDLRHDSTTAKNRAYRARLLALGRAVAKQI